MLFLFIMKAVMYHYVRLENPSFPFFKFLHVKDFIKQVEAFHSASTSKPLVAENHFAVSRFVDITTRQHGRIKIDQLMIYEVKDGQIVVEQFFY